MAQQWGQGPPGFQYSMQTGINYQQQPMGAQQTGYPTLQQPPQQRSAFPTLQAQPTGYPTPQFQQPQATGYPQFQRPAMTGMPAMGYQSQANAPPVPPLPTNLGLQQQQPNRFLSPSPNPSAFSPAQAGPPQGYQPPAPLVAQPTGFMDPRLSMMGTTFMPTAGGGFQTGGLPQFGGATLQQSIAQHNEDIRGTTTQRIPWTLSKQERKQYDQIFRAWDPNETGFLDGQKALEVFGASGLDKDDLAKIWSLADADDRGKLNREEFHVAMGLIYRGLNGNTIPAQLPPELVPASAKSLDESVDMLRSLLKNDTYIRNTGEDAQGMGKKRSLYGNNGTQDARKDGTNYKHQDDDDEPTYRPRDRFVDRRAVSTGKESPAQDLAEMQRQLENAAKRIDKVSTEQAARSAEDEALDRELDDLRRRVKRVQDDLDYATRGPRSFEKDEDKRRLERELLTLLHERLPEVQRKIDEREKRKRREKDDWVTTRDERNASYGRWGGREGERDDYRRYESDPRDRDRNRDEDRGYMRGTYDRESSRERRNYSPDRSYGRDRYDSDRNGRDRPRSPPQNTRTPPPPPVAPVAEAKRAAPSAPSPTVKNTRNMTPEERQAFIRAEAARRLGERQQKLGLISPSVTPAPDTALEERLAKEKAEAAEKARIAEEDAQRREAARQARLQSDRGETSTPIPAAPVPPPVTASPVPVYTAPTPPVAGPAPVKKKPPPPPAPKSALKSSLPSVAKKAPAAPPAPRPPAASPRPVAPTPPVLAPVPPPQSVLPEIDPEEEALRAREARQKKLREDRAARLRELEELEEQDRLEEERLAQRRTAVMKRSATSTPVPAASPAISVAPPAPPPPPAPAAPATSSTNPFFKMQQGGSNMSPATNTPSGFNPFSRPAVSSAPTTMPAVSTPPVAPPPPPAPPARVESPVIAEQKPVEPSPPPAPPATVAPVSYSRAQPQPSRKMSRADSDGWESIEEKEDDDDSSDDDRENRKKLAAHLFGSLTPATPRPDSRASNPVRSSTQTPVPTGSATTYSPPPPAPPAPIISQPIPPAPFAIPDAPAPPPAPFAPLPPSAPIASVGGGGERNALLQSITGGARLRPTKTVDRSGVLGAGAVLGDSAPPAHILNQENARSSSPEPAPVVTNGHAHKESVDWYADLAVDVGSPPAPPPAPMLTSVAEEETTAPVPAITVQDEPIATENDPLEDVDMATTHKVRSLYPYAAQRDEDLGFEENAVIVAHPSKSGGAWWYGISASSGRKGFFPNSYIQVMEEIPAVALYDYQGSTADEMSFNEGQKITIVDRSEGGWWKTEVDGRILIVPAAYLEIASDRELLDPSFDDRQPSSVAASVGGGSELARSTASEGGASDEEEEDDSSEDEWLTDSDEEPQLTDADRQEEQRQRELEKQRVLEAAGLILKQTTEARPPRPPVRARSTRKSLSIKTKLDASTRTKERDLPSLPEPSPQVDKSVDDAFGRYQAFKTQEGNTAAQSQANRQSMISNASTYASTVPPSSPRQPISPHLGSATLPSSASIHSTESKITTLLHFLGRARTPGEGSTTDKKLTVSGPIISGPIALASPSRENSPAFGSSWSSLVDKEALKEIPPHERKRQEALFELINTESAYVRDLQLVVEIFYSNVLALLDEKAISTIFANVEDILLTNTAFLSQLEARQKECRLYIDNIGDLLEPNISSMGVYMQYCVNQATAIKVLQDMRESRPELAAKLLHLRENDQTVRGLDLSSYLLIPMQRITRYPLLIRQILQYTQHGQDRALIERALVTAETILEAINESIREQEGQERLKELSTRLWVGNGQLDLTAPTRYMGQRQLIKEGVVTKTPKTGRRNGRRIRGVLCSDILVLVDETTGSVYRMPIPLSDISVSETLGRRDDLAFVLSTSYPRGGNTISLRATTARECQRWMKAIQEAKDRCVDAEKRHAKRQSTRSSLAQTMV